MVRFSDGPQRRAGLVLVATALMLVLQCHRPPVGSALPGALDELDRRTTILCSDPSDKNERFARRDPLGFLRYCRQRCATEVKDYRCHFVKRERIGGILSPEQQIEVAFRDNPFSVHMNWLEHAGRAQELTYVEDRWLVDNRQLVHIKPTGVLGLLVPSGVKRDIHGPEARAASRRTIDQFGFRNTFDLIIKYCELAKGKPGYGLRYAGIAEVDGREAYVLERRLPFTVENEPYPDRLLLVYVDRRLLLPIACYAYADDAGRHLLGKYISKSIALNVGLTNDDF